MRRQDIAEINIDKVQIGNRIYSLRKSKNLSQMELAELVDMSKNSISNIELGKQLCSTDKLPRFAEALDTSVEYLLHGNEESDSEEEHLEFEMLNEWKKLSLIDKKRMLASIRAFNTAI